LNQAKKEFALDADLDEQISVSIVLEKVNSMLEANQHFSESQLLEEIRAIDSLFFVEESNTIVFL
jgi:hypothetical protein